MLQKQRFEHLAGIATGAKNADRKRGLTHRSRITSAD
jgi:hypothetical protein